MAIRVSWGHMEPPLRGGEVVGVSDMTPFERAMVVSYRLSIVTIALFVTIRPQFAIECFLHFPQNMGFHYPLSIIHMPPTYANGHISATGDPILDTHHVWF